MLETENTKCFSILENNETKQEKPVNKRLTTEQIEQIAQENNIDFAMLMAIIETECKGSGFLKNGNAVILFEKHKFWEQLGDIDFYAVRAKMHRLRPDLCSPSPTKKGGYGSASRQYTKIREIRDLIYTVLPEADKKTEDMIMQCVLKATSFGLGQIMGFNHKLAGFNSVVEFAQAMQTSEYEQLKAMVNLLKAWGLQGAMQRHDFKKIARRWNGAKYFIFGYDKKLRNNYLRYA